MKEKKTSPDQPATTETTQTPKKKKLYDIEFYHDWCKACGICIAFCPRHIIIADKNGKPGIEDPDKCIGCRFCEMHCPDFAITVCDRQPRRRKDDI
ncbi:4Fe-4S binding protein [Desulfogranum japonicum]|uniref:4Fe-4S binding protein n=1 Tax=Desulfogranum japonicum TaxID=231447 RepID=UPI000403DD25|nr:4Fe-4S binding protein [Desulfogranum japonicum]